jgi:hypothetical protein
MPATALFIAPIQLQPADSTVGLNLPGPTVLTAVTCVVCTQVLALDQLCRWDIRHTRGVSGATEGARAAGSRLPEVPRWPAILPCTASFSLPTGKPFSQLNTCNSSDSAGLGWRMVQAHVTSSGW